MRLLYDALSQSTVAEPCAAANCSGRHSLCSHPQTSLDHLSAQAAPPTAVAELGVVRPLRASPVEYEAKYVSHFQGNILVRCPRCCACAHLLAIHRADATHCGHRLICESCAYSAEWNLDSDRSIPVPGSGPHLSGFGLDLWLATSCCGETLWAYNREHLQFLQSYVSARIRAHPRSIRSRLANVRRSGRRPVRSSSVHVPSVQRRQTGSCPGESLKKSPQIHQRALVSSQSPFSSWRCLVA